MQYGCIAGKERTQTCVSTNNSPTQAPGHFFAHLLVVAKKKKNTEELKTTSTLDRYKSSCMHGVWFYTFKKPVKLNKILIWLIPSNYINICSQTVKKFTGTGDWHMQLAQVLTPMSPHHIIPPTHWCIHKCTLKTFHLSAPEPFIAHVLVEKPSDC